MTIKDIPESGECYRCSAVVSNDFYCFGCKEFVCDATECEGNINNSLAATTGYGHTPEDHFVETEFS